MWRVLCEKGYQGLLEAVLAIRSRKYPSRGHVTTQDLRENHTVSSDRVIVENWLGRICLMRSLLY